MTKSRQVRINTVLYEQLKGAASGMDIRDYLNVLVYNHLNGIKTAPTPPLEEKEEKKQPIKKSVKKEKVFLKICRFIRNDDGSFYFSWVSERDHPSGFFQFIEEQYVIPFIRTNREQMLIEYFLPYIIRPEDYEEDEMARVRSEEISYQITEYFEETNSSNGNTYKHHKIGSPKAHFPKWKQYIEDIRTGKVEPDGYIRIEDYR